MVELKLKKPTINQNIFFYFIFLFIIIILYIILLFFFNKTNAFIWTKLGVDTKQHSLYSDAMHLTSTKFSSGLKNQFPTVTPLSWSNI